MKKQFEIDDDVIEIDENADPAEFPPWYNQMMKLSNAKRQEMVAIAMKRLKVNKPDTFDFIKSSKCKLVGIAPAIEYSLSDKKEGEIDVTFVHGFSIPTLVFWHPEGKFAIVVNANLEYDDTVLNKIPGNNVDREIRGVTG